MWLKNRAPLGFPGSLFARLSVILLVGMLAAQGISLWLQSGERATVVAQTRGQVFADRIADAVRVLEAVAPPQRPGVIAGLPADGVVAQLIEEADAAGHAPRGPFQAIVAARLGSEREIRAAGGGMPRKGGRGRSFDVRLLDGQWVRLTAGAEPEAPALPGKLLLQLLLSFAVVLGVVVIAVRQASAPLKQLAEAADSLGLDLEGPPLAERGPIETRRAAQAFNRMQRRVRRLVAERAQALAAVSHDLRTPLTRLRLRTELVADEALREQMTRDLETMAAMLDATLDYLRGVQMSEAPCRIDMNALLQSLTDDARVLGHEIAITGLAQAPYTGRLSALRRALQNLLDNAIEHGQHAHIVVEDSAEALCITVEDEGPGIPPDQLTRVTEPYYRVDAARGAETGGVGLGLAIVQDVALLHGGELVLRNRTGGGLAARLVLPRQASA